MNKRIKKKKQKQKTLQNLEWMFTHLPEVLAVMGEITFASGITIRGEKNV